MANKSSKPTRGLQYGVLKHPGRGNDHISGSPSTENLVRAADSSSSFPLSQVVSNNSSLTMTDRKEKGNDDGDDVFDAPMNAKPRIHFSEGLENSPPYPYSRQDSSWSIATDEDDSEPYDWSDEADLVDEEAKFRGQMGGQKTKKTGWGFKRILSLLFSTLIGSTLLAAILVTPGILVQVYWYKPHPTDHRRYVKDNVQSWLFWAASNILISWGLAMIIDMVPIFIHYLISAVWGHVSESVKTRLETYDSVKDTAKPAFYAASAYASWNIIFGNIYDLFDSKDGSQSRAQYTNRLAQVVEFFFFLILIWCIQRMLSHFVAFSFHRTAYKERIEEVDKSLVVIEKLRQYRPKVIPSHKSGTRTPVFGNLGFTPAPLSDKQHSKLLRGALRDAQRQRRPHSRIENEYDGDVEDPDRTLVDPWNHKIAKGKRSSRRISWFDASADPLTGDFSGSPEFRKTQGGATGEIEIPTPSSSNLHRYPPSHSPRPSVDAVEATVKQAAKVIKHAVLHDARNLSGRSADDLGSLSWNVNSAREAKRLARSIFTRFQDRGRSWLIPSDFYPAFPDHAAAEEAFKVLDKDNNGDLSRAEIKTAVLRIYKERRFLSRSMRDVGEALKTLDGVLRFFAAVVMFFISLSVFGVQIGNSLSSVYTLFIAASFIFKHSASSAFDAIMFLFVSHPYDTGDRVLIDKENLVVKKVGLFATVFSRSDGTESYYFNSQLFNKFILNMRRSGKTFENLTMQVVWTTPLTKLDALEKCLNDWLSTEENRWYEPSTNIVLQNISFQRYLELTIGIGHNGNWQDWGLRNARKTAFHAAVQYYCRQLDIKGYEAPLPIVYANPDTMKYQPAPSQPEATSPIEAAPPLSAQQAYEEAVATEVAAKAMKPTLGFLPPLADRSSNLTRARKSRHRKAILGAGAGNG
ncbi:hypothetical protein M413DRAFT_23733 [Hebeloma cylindrosporum]|uniref:EF-hand domain-containing protein n=1 Tax=Hebeloma cylindrosporum TaxID=76867 RepID=A0A0C2Y7T0_HEBCY|nr:hypothetical protein M413DRAFT_23733 [Hebeloma cylindrosporum h7]